MLPFLKLKQEGSASSPVDCITRKSDGESDSDYDMLEAAAEDLVHAVHSKNTKQVCAALRAAFEIYDSEPHYEGPHEED